MITVKIHVPSHYAWGNDDNPRVPMRKSAYSPYLLSNDGLCCLGFAGRALGVSDEDLQDAAEPPECNEWVPDDVFVIARYKSDTTIPDTETTEFTGDCIELNDAMEGDYEHMSYKERMEKLKEIGLKHGIDFQFTWEDTK